MRSHLDCQYWTSVVDCSIGGVPPEHSIDRVGYRVRLLTHWPCSWAGCRSGKLGSHRSACRPREVSSGPPRCWSWRVWRPRLWVLPALVKYQVSVRNVSITVNSSNWTVRLQLSTKCWIKSAGAGMKMKKQSESSKLATSIALTGGVLMFYYSNFFSFLNLYFLFHKINPRLKNIKNSFTRSFIITLLKTFLI